MNEGIQMRQPCSPTHASTHLLPPGGVGQQVQVQAGVGHNGDSTPPRWAQAPGEGQEERRGPEALGEGQGRGEQDEAVPEAATLHLVDLVGERPAQPFPEKKAGLWDD